MLSNVRQNPDYTQTRPLIQMDCIWLVVMGPSLLKWHQAALGIVHYRAAHVETRPGKAIKHWFRIHTESNGSTIIWIRATMPEPSRHVSFLVFFATFAGNETTWSVTEPFNSIAFSRNVRNGSGPTPTENSVKWICCVKVNGNDSVNKTIWDCMSGCGGSEPQVKETVSLSHCLQRSRRKQLKRGTLLNETSGELSALHFELRDSRPNKLQPLAVATACGDVTDGYALHCWEEKKKATSRHLCTFSRQLRCFSSFKKNK